MRRHLGREQAKDTDATRKLIAGLGNPGVQYLRNRHNVGFLALDHLAELNHLNFARRRFNALLAEGVFDDQRLLLAKPQTFMNASGSALAKLVAFNRIPTRDIIVIYDDLDLPFGKIRVRARGSAGGHHGMESIINALGTSDFPRLRIGIGRPASREDIGHVLGNFSEEEERALEEIFARVENALRVWLNEGIEKAMSLFNGQ